MTDDRLSALQHWLSESCGLVWDDIVPASADASFRRYFRVTGPAGSRIVMDAPPDREDCRPFLRVADWLERIGLNAPRVLARDLGQGFLLLTDLGDELYLTALEADPSAADSLYGAAIDALVKMQSAGGRFESRLPPYDAALLHREMALFRDWLCQRHLELGWSRRDEQSWSRLTGLLAARALGQPRVFVHRDYHSRNLMLGVGEPPGILDFQDAVAGPVTYDLVSLLKDCYIAWPAERILGWMQDYRRAAGRAGIETGADGEEFLAWFDLMGVQRHLKAAGIFARLWHRDGKPGYLPDVPRTLQYIRRLGDAYPELDWLQDLIRGRIEPRLAERMPCAR